MSERPETPAERLARTSEVYRRMRAEEQPVPLTGPVEVQKAEPPPPVPPVVSPAPPPTPARNPSFVRRLLTRRPDTKELLLLGIIAVAVVFSLHPF